MAIPPRTRPASGSTRPGVPPADTRSADKRGSEVVSEPLQCRPARVGRALRVLVRLLVQVLAADGAQTRAVLAAEDLIRKLERDGVARPDAQLELLVDDVVGVQLVCRRGVEIVEFARAHLSNDLGKTQTAHARPTQVCLETHVEH